MKTDSNAGPDGSYLVRSLYLILRQTRHWWRKLTEWITAKKSVSVCIIMMIVY